MVVWYSIVLQFFGGVETVQHNHSAITVETVAIAVLYINAMQCALQYLAV